MSSWTWALQQRAEREARRPVCADCGTRFNSSTDGITAANNVSVPVPFGAPAHRGGDQTRARMPAAADAVPRAQAASPSPRL
ncbi:hypothetical protein ACFYP4_22255 [Streptomyces sp. NPDC005551]|uniref:hypothetical protein n=1 Tax=unclassified Streptomyces TaxID=2593676 RepID=UPI0033CA7E9D